MRPLRVPLLDARKTDADASLQKMRQETRGVHQGANAHGRVVSVCPIDAAHSLHCDLSTAKVVEYWSRRRALLAGSWQRAEVCAFDGQVLNPDPALRTVTLAKLSLCCCGDELRFSDDKVEEDGVDT